MSEKTIDQLLEEKRVLEGVIMSEVDAFLKENPPVRFIDFNESIIEFEVSCGYVREFNLSIKIGL
jgi:hypothetical protein